MSEKEIGKFNLEAPAQNNYANLILLDMRNYQHISSQRYNYGARFSDALMALRQLISDLPPKGKQHIFEKYPNWQGLNCEKLYGELNGLGLDKTYSQMDEIFNFAMEWLWPNVLELQINTGKPAYGTEGHLGNRPR